MDFKKYKDVTDFLGAYGVSESGDVVRLLSAKSTRVGRICKPFLSQDGYLKVSLCLRGQRQHKFIHDLVSREFLGPRPCGTQVNHKDGKKTNNHFSNLEYVTAKENVRHAWKLGLCKPRKKRAA